MRSVVADPDSLDPMIVEASAALAREGGLRQLMGVMAQTGRSTFRILAQPQVFARILDRVTCPVLVLHGRRDRTIPCEFALAAARLHPSWRLHIFGRVGHLPHLEDSSGWLSVVESWLDETFPR
ncbi:MAG: hypothetical protein H0U08_09140 [Actinobacteria bacterium]|nr:hypothetical protein [Actinomycetota bacterium]